MSTNKNSDHDEHKQNAENQKTSPDANQSDQSDSSTPQPETSPQEESHPAQVKHFPIVGIGASAGGLEAFERFFTSMPPDSGMAFVLVQHLDPTHESILVDLVKRYTRMQVVQVKDGLAVEPNHIYVIPPNRNMALLRGTLYLMEPVAVRGLRLPIDFFFRSLAEDQGEKAICIVLSGTGTDGALGLKAIKGEGGMATVQEPASAKYDGMPRSAVATGLVDYVLPPEQMPEQLIQYVNHAAFVTGVSRKGPLLPQGTDWLQKIFILLRGQTGHDFSLYKQNTINRRIERRMMVNQVERATDYIRYLQQSPLEIETLFRELLIGVTNFFRDPEAFETLQQKVIPHLFKERALNQTIRIWVPGCSTGEEAYSIAILLRERMTASQSTGEVQVFATDIDNQAIEKARLGLYPDSIAADVSPERLQRFFIKEGDAYQVSKQIRDMVIFAVQSIIKDPPFSKLDLISCRNLLIYLESGLQRQIIPLFHYALKPNGFLFLGPSEGLGKFVDLFHPINRRWKLFQRSLGDAAQRATLDFPVLPLAADKVLPAAGEVNKTITIRQLTEQLLLESYAPSCVVTDEQGEILYFHGRTGKYLEPVVGEANLNILRMAREGLRMPLTAALRKAVTQKQPVIYEKTYVKSGDETRVINLILKPILKPAAMQGLILVVFEEAALPEPVEAAETGAEPPAGEEHHRIVTLEQELTSTRQYLQTTIEELETSNEELKSTNEELQSSNEELQSANQELETSKEELQSVNEELITVNSELQTKIEALTQANNDVNNLLTSTEIGIIFLDLNLTIKRFTPSAAQVVNLIETDLDRPISHIASNLEDEDLIQDAQEVLVNLVVKEKEVQTRQGRWYLLRVMPYRTVENIIDGVVITFTDVTEQKRFQEQLSRLMRAVEQSGSMVMVTDIAGYIEYVNPQFSQVTGYSLEEVTGRKPNLLKSGQQSPEFYQRLWETILAGQDWRGELCNRKKNGEFYWVSASISPVENAAGEATHFIAVEEDITERKQVETALHESEAFLRDIYAGIGAAIYVIEVTKTGEFRYQAVNPAFERLTGRTNEMIRGKRLEELEPPLSREVVTTATIHYRQCVESGQAIEYEQKAPTQKQEAWWQVRLEPLQNERGDVYRIIGTGTPITGRKRAEKTLWRAGRLFEALGEWQQTLVSAAGTSPALGEMCRLLVEVGGYRLAWIGLADSNGAKWVEPVAQAGYAEDALVTTGLRVEREQGQGPLETALRTNQPAVIRSIDADPAYAPWREEATKHGYKSFLSLPWVTEDDTLGLLNLYAAEPDAFAEAEVDLLQKLTDNLRQGLHFLRRRDG